MNVSRPLSIIALLCGLTTLGACSAGQAPPAGTPTSASSTSNSLIGNVIDHAMYRASEKLRTKNITISNHDDTSSLPKAQITPEGDLLIAGKAVTVTPAQHSMLLDYRAQLVAIAMQGMTIGKQGAALGMKATGEALAGVFSGKSDEQIQQQVQAQASGIKQSAAKLCDRLPGLMASQQKIAASLPAFRPYATMTQHDIDDCMKNDVSANDTSRAQIREEIRERIRNRIRSSTQSVAQGAGLASRGSAGATPPASAGTTARH